MIQGIDNVGIAARDLEASVAFYLRIGFALESRGERGVLMSAGGARLFLFSSGRPAEPVPDRGVNIATSPPGLDHVSLRVDDVDRTCANLRARGVALLMEPADTDWGARAAAAADPDGNVVFLLRWLP